MPTSSLDPVMFGAPLRPQLESFVDDHREALLHCLDGLSEDEARRRLVPSKTTLLGLVKHATFVEKVWFDEAVTGRSREEIGLPPTPDESFDLSAEEGSRLCARVSGLRARSHERLGPTWGWTTS